MKMKGKEIQNYQQYQLIEKEGLLMLNRSLINIYDLNTSNLFLTDKV